MSEDLDVMVYVVQMLFILLCGYFFKDDKKKFLTVAFIALFFVMAFRSARMVGNDSSSSYYDEFVVIKSFEWVWPNPGLPFVMKLIKIISQEYQWVIIITAGWVCFAYYRLLMKYSENGFISVMWFMGMLFYTFLFSALKQAWAMAFLCFAFDAVVEKKPIRFIVYVGLAAFFHFPAFVFLPAYFIGRLKINKMFPIILAIVLVFVFVFRTTILGWMTSTYAKGEGDYSGDTRFIGTKFVFMVLILGFGFYQYYHSGVKHKTYTVLLYYMGIAAIIQTFCFYNNIFERLADYYYQFSILFMPLILKETLQKDKKVTIETLGNGSIKESHSSKSIKNYSLSDISVSNVLAIVITVFCIWRFISFSINGTDHLSPFYFFWQEPSTIAL